jgi:hypothetical protein
MLFMKCLYVIRKSESWCAVSAWRIIGPIFLDETINSECDLRSFLTPFLDQLTEAKKAYGHFMQGSAIAHTTNNSVNAIVEVFGE